MEAKAVLWQPPEANADATAAVTDLYQGHALGLMRLALMMVGDRPTAEDVVQEAFLGLYRRWSHVRDREKALSYVQPGDLPPAFRLALHDRGDARYVAAVARSLPGVDNVMD